jgi:hypothetical protein
MLPVAPVKVHSGVPPLTGSATGQGLAGAAGVLIVDDTLSTALADDESVFEPQPASSREIDAAQATSATDGDRRDEFTVAHATAAIRAIDQALRFVLDL